MSEQESELTREDLLKRYAKDSRAAATGRRRSPFKFLDSYGVDDADIFFGRDLEIEELRRHFHGHGHVLVYGESGSGKSSLVECGLGARIPEADALFISLRVHAAGLSTVCLQIYESAARALGVAAEVPAEPTLVKTLGEVREAASRPVVLFFDQFEELFIFHDADTRRRFADELAAVATAKLNIKIIIGVRQDYLAHLSELEDTVEGLFDNRFWLRRMSRENAAQAVVKACATCDVKIDEELAESVIHRLAPGGQGVELPYLQVVMDRLYRQAIEEDPERPEITADDVEKLGDIANILGTFLTEEVAKLPSPDTGRQMLKALVTREATRRTLDRAAVGQESAGFGGTIPQSVLDAHLDQLASVRVLREIADTGSFELRHDALAATVAGWISEVEKELIEVRDNLLNRFKEYEARGMPDDALLDQGFLDYLAVYRQRLKPLLRESLELYLETSQRHVEAAMRRRRRTRRTLTGVVGSVLLLFLAIAVWQWVDADQKRADAVREKGRADQKAAEALAEKQRADLLTAEATELLTVSEMRLYASHIQSAQREWESGNASAAHHRWQQCDRDLRGWEHAYLATQFNRGHRTFKAPMGVEFIAFSPSGQRILQAGGSFDAPPALLNIGTGVKTPLEQHKEDVFGLAFSPDGQRFVTGGRDQIIRVFHVEHPQEPQTLGRSDEMVVSLAFSRDGRLVRSVGYDGTLQEWAIEKNGKAREPLDLGHDEPLRCLAFSRDGGRLVSVSSDGILKVWDVESRDLKLTLEGPEGWISRVAASSDGQWIVGTGSQTGSGNAYSLKKWDVETGEIRWNLPGQAELARALAVSPDGKLIVSGGEDSRLKLWDAVTGEPLGILVGHRNSISALSFSPDGQTIASASTDGTFRLWEVGASDKPLTLEGHADRVWCLAASPDGRRIASGGMDDTIRLWDVETGENTWTQEKAGKVHAVAFSPDGLRIVHGHDDTLQLRDAGTGEVKLNFGKHASYVRSVTYHPGGLMILSVGSSGKLKLWNARTGDEVWTRDRVGAAAFSRDGRNVVGLCHDRKIRRWNIETGEEVSTRAGPSGSCNSAAFSPDGRWVVIVGGGVTLALFDLESGEETTLEGHTSHVWSAAFSPDSRRIVSGGSDKTLKLWDVETGVETLTLKGHTEVIFAAVFSPDGRRIVSGSMDFTLKIWDAGEVPPR